MNSKRKMVPTRNKQSAYIFEQNSRFVAFALHGKIVTFSTYPRATLDSLFDTIEKAGYATTPQKENLSIIQEKNTQSAQTAFLVKVGKALFNAFNGQGWDSEIQCTYPAYFPEFTKRVFDETQKIPIGQVATYGEIAERIGSPGGARAVGNAMAKCPLGLIVPCHRVVKSNGRVGFFLAQEILEREGVQFRRRWVVQLPRD